MNATSGALSDGLPEPRTAELILVTPGGAVIGRLSAMPIATPWWQDIEPVVRAARDTHGIDIVVLRLLHAERDRPHGGRVTYLAEVARPVPAEPWSGTLDDHPLRHSFARLDGPAADLAWANSVLRERALSPAGRPVQIRTWNLSSLWRIPTTGRTAWLKVVPGFFAHEGPLLAALAGEPVPEVLGQDGGRILLAEIAGSDLYEAELPQFLEMIALLVRLQRSWRDRQSALLALGLPDWRAPALTASIADVFQRASDELSVDDRATMTTFVRGLPARFRQLAACGIDDTLVHGDFHPGNFRGNHTTLALLDWGDSGVGHPLLDQPAFLSRIPCNSLDAARENWLKLRRDAIPGCDPERAATLIGPVAAARQAVVYQRFLDHIEPAEAVYHRRDVAQWLRTAARLCVESASA